MNNMDHIDFEWLENVLFFTQKEQPNAILSICAADLLHPVHIARLLDTYLALLKASDIAVAGTYFFTWFRAVCLVQQYLVSVHHTALDLTLSNLNVQLYMKGNYARFSFRCEELRECPAPKGARDRWRKEVFTSLYRDQVRPLVESIARSVGVNPGHLWGQFPSGFHYYLELFMEQARSETVRKQLAEDYRYLSKELDGAVFGRKKNPFDVKIRLIENPYSPGKLLCIKTACCMYYQTAGGDYCYTCPKLSQAGRAKLRMKLLGGE